MTRLQKILLAVFVIAAIVLIVVTWGSISSIILAVSLVMILPIYLHNRFLNTDEKSDFAEDDNG